MSLPQSTPFSSSSNFLPTVKCSICGLPVPLTSLGQHVCSPPQQRHPPTPVSPFQQHPVPPAQLVPPMQPRTRTDSQSPPRLRPSITTTPDPNAISHVPFPTVSTPPPRQEDYMPGGESGMAGVGRRAFQAAAHAAVFAQHQYNHSHHHNPSSYTIPPMASMQGRRPHLPQFLDIARASGRGTPPLSPNSTHSSPRSHSPLSPLSHSPNTVPSGISNSRTPSPSLHAPMSSSRSFSNPTPTSTSNATTPTSATSRLPFFQKYKNTLDQTSPVSPGSTPIDIGFSKPSIESVPPSSPTDSDSDGGGLAYDRDDTDTRNEGELVGKMSLDDDRSSASSHSAYSAASGPRFVRDDLSPASPRRSHTTPTVGPRGGPGGLSSPLGSVSPPGAGAARSISDAKILRRGKEKEVVPRTRVCARCDCRIESGRWIRAETSQSVMCERCWKNMYLPKCRRCDQPIEQAAVFSSDGQLKGKYHRHCFTCYTCHQPFPDKSFYVYDGHPMCAFHYHQANRSLCASLSCGRPIEGPCAITYLGDRYHPDCLRCGHTGCDERLEDYWEVGNMMLCERHAQSEKGVDEDYEHVYGGEDEDDEEADDLPELARILSVRRPGPGRRASGETRAQKRTTRLINLTGTGLGF
ncbi:hypothetical protein K439DRAFT_1659657 [Ramaria rubella]|nr:hypothetical protein K439DRAFT_1659657 [Ramaria rubella]